MKHTCAHCGEEIQPHDLCHAITDGNTKHTRFYHGTGVCNYVANEGRLPDPDDWRKFTDVSVVTVPKWRQPPRGDWSGDWPDGPINEDGCPRL